MFEFELLPTVAVLFAGVVIGILATLLFNKVRTGSVSAGKIKREKDDYQIQVEAHFEETSKKFKEMATQYQDLYQHLSVGATNLCRPDKIAAGLIDQRSPLSATAVIESDKSRQDHGKSRSHTNTEPPASKAAAAAAKPDKSNLDTKPEAGKAGLTKADAKQRAAAKPNKSAGQK